MAVRTWLILIALAGVGAGMVAAGAWRYLSRSQPLPAVYFLDPDTTAPPPMAYKTFHSVTINADASYLIYLPPGYDQGEQRYPVIYWLHGLGGSPSRGGPSFAKDLDEAIRAGDAPPAIVVSVNGLEYSRWYDSKDGTMPVDTVFIKDLIPHIDATYRTIDAREGRAVEGFSMGGFGAIRFGFKYPDVFAAATSISGAFRSGPGIRGGPISGESWSRAHFQKIFGGDTEYYLATSPQVLAEKNADQIRGRLRIRLYAGADDGQGAVTDNFHALLEKRNIPHDYARVPGVAHRQQKMYDTLGRKHFQFYREVFPSP
jgi:endo-1,4-beta-xylanase